MYDEKSYYDIIVQEIALGIPSSFSSGPCDKNAITGLPYISTIEKLRHFINENNIEEKLLIKDNWKFGEFKRVPFV